MNYAGKNNLEIMEEAENYNNFLADSIIQTIPKRAHNIVDFGSGTGFFAKKISPQIKKEIICIEPAANLRGYYAKSNLRLIRSLDRLEFNKTDFIYSLNVLEHIEEDDEVVKNMHKKLKKGGKVFIYVPAFPMLFSKMDEDVEHIRRYTQKELITLFKRNKFKVQECIYVDSLGFFATLIFKLINRNDGALNPKALKFYDSFVFPVSRFIDRITCGKLLGKNLLLIAKK